MLAAERLAGRILIRAARDVIIIPEFVAQHFQRRLLLAADLARAHPQLAAHGFLVVLFDVAVEERFIHPPGVRIGRFAGLGFEGLDGCGQDALELGRGIETGRDMK